MDNRPKPVLNGLHPAPVSLPVAEQIKQYILLNRLGPGSPLPAENELSEALQVSRSRVREAIKALSALDIVEVHHGYGTYVGRMRLTGLVQSLAFKALLDADQDRAVLSELIDIRELLETSLAAVITERMTPDELTRLRDLGAAMRAKEEAGEEFRAEDREFHLVLLGAAGNSLAVQLTGAFWDVHAIALEALPPAPAGAPGDLTTAQAHEAIVAALQARDADRLVARVRDHYLPVRARLAPERGDGAGSAASASMPATLAES